MHAEGIISTFSTSNIYIRLCLPKALTLTRLQSYTLFRNNKSVSLRAIVSFPLLSDVFPHQLARGIPLKVGVPYPRQSMIRTPPPHLGWTILAWQISLNAWLPPRLLHSDGEQILQLLRRVQAVVVHQHPEEAHRQTRRVALYAAPHLALLALPLLPAVLKTCLPPSLI